MTELGQRLGAKVDAVTAANQTLGYGLLSALGKEEHANLATRLAERLPTLLTTESTPLCLKVETSGRIAPTKAPTSSCRAWPNGSLW